MLVNVRCPVSWKSWCLWVQHLIWSTKINTVSSMYKEFYIDISTGAEFLSWTVPLAVGTLEVAFLMESFPNFCSSTSIFWTLWNGFAVLFMIHQRLLVFTKLVSTETAPQICFIASSPEEGEASCCLTQRSALGGKVFLWKTAKQPLKSMKQLPARLYAKWRILATLSDWNSSDTLESLAALFILRI